MKLRIALAILCLLVIVGILGGIYASNIMAMIAAGESMSGPMPETVEIRKVEHDNWSRRIQAVGTIAAINGIMLRMEADGRIESIHFSSGDAVEKGAVLLRLNSAVEAAQLEVARAAKRLAQANAARTRELHSRQSVSDAEMDAAMAAYEQSSASVANLEAVLELRTLRAPFSGRAGVLQLSVGDFVNRGQAIVSLQSLDRMRVDFNLPQNELSRLSVGQQVELRTDAWPDRIFAGRLHALDADIRISTRTLQLQAELDNTDGKLLPGMFVRVDLIEDQLRPVILVPQTAIRFATFGNSVFVVNPDAESGLQRASQQLVRLGETMGDFVEITEGLSGSEQIVSSGVFKLRDGSFVVHSDVGTVQPLLNPTPENR